MSKLDLSGKPSSDHTAEKNAFFLAEEISAEVQARLGVLDVTDDMTFKLYLVASFVRCFNFHESVVLLCKSRLVQPAVGALRSMQEQRWVYALLANEETRQDSFTKLMKQDDEMMATTIKKLRALPPEFLDERITEKRLIDWEGTIGTDREKAVSKAWADAAGLDPEYQTEYRFLSMFVHPTSLSVEKHFVINDEQKFQTITKLPALEIIPLALVTSCRYMLDLLEAFPEFWPDMLLQKVPAWRCQVSESMDLICFFDEKLDEACSRME